MAFDRYEMTAESLPHRLHSDVVIRLFNRAAFCYLVPQSISMFEDTERICPVTTNEWRSEAFDHWASICRQKEMDDGRYLFPDVDLDESLSPTDSSCQVRLAGRDPTDPSISTGLTPKLCEGCWSKLCF